jgi:hypothetical protein
MTSWVPLAGSAAHRPEAVLTSSVAIGPAETIFQLLATPDAEHEASETVDPAVDPFSARHQPLMRMVPSVCGCQCCQPEFAQVTSTALVPEVPTHLPGTPETRAAAGRSQCSLVELPHGSITGLVPLATLAVGAEPVARHLPDCGLTSWPSVSASHICRPSLTLHGSNSSLAPPAVLLPIVCRHLPPVLSVPSWTAVQFWFDLPVQLHSWMLVPFAVLPDGSSRHLALPPTCLTVPAVPAVGAARSVQVNVAVPVPPRASVAVTVTLNAPDLLGQPVTRPVEFIDTPVGSPVALSVAA